MKKTPPPKVIDPDAEVGAELLAKAIVDVSDAARKLLDSPLKMRAILVLIHDASDVPLVQIRKVLESAADLRREYVK